MMISGFLVLPLDAQNLTQQHSNLSCSRWEKLTKVDVKSTKLAVVGSAQRTVIAVLKSVGMLEYRFVFALVFML